MCPLRVPVFHCTVQVKSAYWLVRFHSQFGVAVATRLFEVQGSQSPTGGHLAPACLVYSGQTFRGASYRRCLHSRASWSTFGVDCTFATVSLRLRRQVIARVLRVCVCVCVCVCGCTTYITVVRVCCVFEALLPCLHSLSGFRVTPRVVGWS